MKYSSSFLLLAARGCLSFVLPDNNQFPLSTDADFGNAGDIFSSLEQKFEKKIDRFIESFERGANTVNEKSKTPIHDVHKQYAAALAGAVTDSMNRQRGGRYRDYPGRDDMDPEDGTDPGDGPPYYRNPKEPPHHTPSPPRAIPRVPRPRMPPKDHTGPHKDSTMWELISKSKHTTRFYEMAKKDNDVMDILKDTNRKTTLFAPSNNAFRELDQMLKDRDVPKDMMHRIMMYHLSDGCHESDDLRYRNTLSTMLSDNELGKGMKQRLRIGLSHEGPTLNFYSEVTMFDIIAKNGVIHGVDSVLIPPPELMDLIMELPTEFSTSLTAFSRAGLMEEFRKMRGNGGTIFAPSNRDWQKLGFDINAFLFSDSGKPYLRALMKYHISPGRTLYSDALLVPKGERDNDERHGSKDPNSMNWGYSHINMPTMLKDKCLSVDITRVERFLSFRVNGMASIIISDAMAKTGSIQVPDHVLLPPHSMHEHRYSPDRREMMKGDERQSERYGMYTLSDMKEALEPFVERERAELANSTKNGQEIEL